MKYIQNHIPIGKFRPGINMTPTTITIHSTGNPKSSAKNERAWLSNPANDRIASWHVCVDENEAYEAIPLSEVAFHAGNAAGNSTSIGIEICESGDRKNTVDNAVKLVAQMLNERSWGVAKLKRHYDWIGKNCPRIMNEDGKWTGWHEFKKAVEKELKPMADKPSDWAKEAWEWAIKQGITDGTNPQGTITREQVVTMIFRALKK